MDYFAGLDVSVKDTSVCIVNDAGKIVREVKVSSEPEALLAALKNLAYRFKRIGSECGGFERENISAAPAIAAHCKLPSKLSDCPYNCKACKKDREKRIVVQIDHHDDKAP